MLNIEQVFKLSYSRQSVYIHC